VSITQEEFNALMAQWIADNGGQYNSAHSGAQIDAAVTAVKNKEAQWDAGGGADLIVTAEYDNNWAISNISEDYADIEAALLAGQGVVLKIYAAGTSENPYILYPAMHLSSVSIAFALTLGDDERIMGLNVILTPDGGATATNSHYDLIPAGGTAGQVLAKATDADRDVKWVNQAAGEGISVSASGFVTFAVESDGKLYAYTADDMSVPSFEYDEATGALYYITEEGTP